ncbi:MAG: hypothetical protein LBE25_04190 [Arthrobacter sp.]|nr:hypothetical protein [Arthrobacter sp.]
MRTLPRAAAALALLSALTVSGLAAAPAQAAPAASATQATVATSTVAAASKTRITTQPKSVGIRGTQKATFKVKAVGSKLRYQWYVKAPGKKSFKAIKGATKASYTTPKQANKTRSSQYRVVVAGSRGKVTSKSATLKVKAWAKPAFSSTALRKVQYKKGVRFEIRGKNFAGAEVIPQYYEGWDESSLRLVSRSSTRIVLEVTKSGGTNLNALMVKNPAGRAEVDIDLLAKWSSERHQVALAKVREFVANHPRYRSSARGAQIEGVLSVIRGNTGLWKPLDEEASDYLSAAEMYMFYQECRWDYPGDSFWMEAELNARDDLDEAYSDVAYWVKYYPKG